MSVSKELIGSIRIKFLAEAQQNPDKYHSKDLECIKINDWSIERFALVTKNEDAALAALTKTMEWRNVFGVNDFTDQSFPQEVYKIGFVTIYPHKDKEGRTILWNRMGHYHKSDLSQILRQYVVYQFEKCDRGTSHQGWAMIADTCGAGLSNVDMDYSNFLTEVLQTHYPRGLKYQAIVDLPWILNATLKLILAFMNDEMKSTVKTVKKDNLLDYLNPEQIPVHLKGSYSGPIFTVPAGTRPIEEVCNFSPEQLKKIRSTFKDELKEC